MRLLSVIITLSLGVASAQYPVPGPIVGGAGGGGGGGGYTPVTLVCDGTTDNSATIQAALNATSKYISFFQTGTCAVAALITIPSNSSIIIPAGMTLFKKANSVGSGEPCFFINSDTSGGNSNFSISGGGTLDCNGANQTFTDSTSAAGAGVRFVNVDHVYFGNLTIKNPGFFNVHFIKATHVVVENILFEDGYVNNARGIDGIHFNGPSSNFSISHIKCGAAGGTNDDTVAINADDVNQAGAEYFQGDISNFNVDDVECSNAINNSSAIRMLVHTHQISNGTFSNFKGTWPSAFVHASWYPDGTANTGTIVNITYHDNQADSGVTPYIYTANSCSGQKVINSRHSITNSATAKLAAISNCTDFEFEHVGVFNYSGGSGPLITTPAGTISLLKIGGLYSTKLAGGTDITAVLDTTGAAAVTQVDITDSFIANAGSTVIIGTTTPGTTSIKALNWNGTMQNSACGSTTQIQINTSGLCAGTSALPTGTTATTGGSGSQVATNTDISNAIAGVNPAIAVLAASTANLTGTYSNGAAGIGAIFTVTATGAFSLDGIAINTIGQRVLLKDQSSAFQNGVYFATVVGAVAVSPVFTRALDYDTPSDINSTGTVPVQSGTVNTTTSWLLTSSVTTVGTDALTYTQFSYAPRSCSGQAALTGDVSNTAGSCTTTIGAAKVAPSMMKASTFDVQTDGATVTWAIASVLNAQAQLTFTAHSGSRTLNITNPVIGGNYVLVLIQDGTGGEGLILGTGCTWKVVNGGSGAVTLSTGANARDVLAFTYDATNCYATLGKNYN